MARVRFISNSLIQVGNILGECPLWHPTENALYWLDIDAGLLHRFTPYLEKMEVFDLGLRAGSFGFRKNGGLVLATETGFAFWSEQAGASADIVWLYPKDGPIMMNDGRVDSQGRFWAGSKGPAGASSLFQLRPDGSYAPVLNNLTISNGIDWSPDGRFCYFTDSGEQAIYRYAVQDDNLHEKELFFSTSLRRHPGTPDGLCVDAAGNIWSAIWDGSKVIQLSPQAEILQEIYLPVSRPTSIAFGGADLRDLYITSASVDLTPEQLSNQPRAGDLFRCRVEIPGRPPHFFAG
ncbi:MAG: SMP-30/gluconolactonase/LRE family protein [Chloroflexi bacterium]|jgi:sugar lactone lactonase YvrE|nr:SMP-30/gluconolactonase/LRE family protein [Anaerolineaceae bacterium]NLI44212.1 SMP-30/gluconolactonase/LRE family protein [Chloroflexota bacterium]HOE35668.1 SMP-30/gluconolactonase/LRE family protein [Anaerolineaceae bacterium]HOT24928.1 SMP-30/gluconolactonase/LRE family protein [Anaerolineaceae bacterium]HQH57521.1 SMP-30/gluconolactonase/LRE family protein [Anaerolineaceae bacterium]